MTLLRLIGLHEFFTFKALYFMMYAGLGVLFPYIPVYFELMSMSKSQIGILSMMPNFCSFLVAPLFSIISDMFNVHYELMVVCLVTSTIFTSTTLLCSTFGQFSMAVLSSSIMRAPVSPNVDALVISSLENKTRYGEMRLWGAVSFGIFSLIGGLLTAVGRDPTERLSAEEQAEDRTNEIMGFHFVFYLHAFFSLSAGLIILYVLYRHVQSTDILSRLRRTPQGQLELTPLRPNGHSDHNKDEPKVSISAALVRVFRAHPSVGIFSLVVFLSGFGSGVIDAFLFLRLKQLGGSGLVMGISRFITCAAEVPMFQLAGSWHHKYGTWPMLTLTQAAFLLRFTYYTFLAEPWAVLPCEVLHGLTFAVTWSVSCTYANMISPPECHSTMQALLEGLHWGFGSGMGALVGGYLYDSIGAVGLFEVSGFLSFCSMILAAFMWITVGRSDEPTSPSHSDIGANNGSSSSRNSSAINLDEFDDGISLMTNSNGRSRNHEAGNAKGKSVAYSTLRVADDGDEEEAEVLF